MLNIFLQSALTLPIMCYLMCSMLELRWPLRKSVAVMFVFMGFITLCDVVLASGSLNYAQIVDFYLFTTTLPALICFFILSKNRGFYFFFAYFTACIFAQISNILAAMGSWFLTGGNEWLSLFIRILFLFVMAYAVRKFLREPFLFASHYYRWQWAAYAALPLLMMVGQALYTARPEPADVTGMVKLPYLSWLYPSEFGYAALFLLCVLVGYYFIGNTFYTEHRLYQEQQEQQNFKFQAEALAKRCGTYQTAQENTRRIRHDIRHHVTVLTGLLADGKVEDARDYLSRLSDAAGELKVWQYCQNPVVNSVLSVFHEQALAQGITTDFQVEFPTDPPIDPLELGVVLANALENAINACQKVTAAEKRVCLIFRYFGDRLIFQVTNPYAGTIAFDENGEPVAMREGHGNGCRSIAAFSKKYHSTVDYQAENGVFTLCILVDDLTP